MEKNPYAGPGASLTQGVGSEQKTAEIAQAQKMLLVGILASLISNYVSRSTPMPLLLMLLIALAVAAFNIYSVYRLCKALDLAPAIWIILMFIPLANLVALVILIRKATAYLREQGKQVGFLGVKD